MVCSALPPRTRRRRRGAPPRTRHRASPHRDRTAVRSARRRRSCCTATAPRLPRLGPFTPTAGARMCPWCVSRQALTSSEVDVLNAQMTASTSCSRAPAARPPFFFRLTHAADTCVCRPWRRVTQVAIPAHHPRLHRYYAGDDLRAAPTRAWWFARVWLVFDRSVRSPVGSTAAGTRSCAERAGAHERHRQAFERPLPQRYVTEERDERMTCCIL